MRSAYVHEIYVSQKLRRYPAFSARFFLLFGLIDVKWRGMDFLAW